MCGTPYSSRTIRTAPAPGTDRTAAAEPGAAVMAAAAPDTPVAASTLSITAAHIATAPPTRLRRRRGSLGPIVPPFTPAIRPIADLQSASAVPAYFCGDFTATEAKGRAACQAHLSGSGGGTSTSASAWFRAII